MTSEHAKKQILDRIHSAVASIDHRQLTTESTINGYHGKTMQEDDLINRFCDALQRVGGVGNICEKREEVAVKLTEILKAINVKKIAVSNDISVEKIGVFKVLNEVNCIALRQDSDLIEQAAVDVGITLAYAGIADTGTIVIPHRNDNGRLAALLPPIHIALLKRNTVYSNKPDLLLHFRDLNVDINNTPISWITGPSLTADIEKVLVRGAHGPRQLIVIIY